MIPNHGPTLEFGLGETADAIRETTARFAADKIAPIAAQMRPRPTFFRELWPQMGALGLHGVTVEEAYGRPWSRLPQPVRGRHGGEVSRHRRWMGQCQVTSSNLMRANQIRRWGADEQKLNTC